MPRIVLFEDDKEEGKKIVVGLRNLLTVERSGVSWVLETWENREQERERGPTVSPSDPERVVQLVWYQSDWLWATARERHVALEGPPPLWLVDIQVPKAGWAGRRELEGFLRGRIKADPDLASHCGEGILSASDTLQLGFGVLLIASDLGEKVKARAVTKADGLVENAKCISYLVRKSNEPERRENWSVQKSTLLNDSGIIDEHCKEAFDEILELAGVPRGPNKDSERKKGATIEKGLKILGWLRGETRRWVTALFVSLAAVFTLLHYVANATGYTLRDLREPVSIADESIDWRPPDPSQGFDVLAEPDRDRSGPSTLRIRGTSDRSFWIMTYLLLPDGAITTGELEKLRAGSWVVPIPTDTGRAVPQSSLSLLGILVVGAKWKRSLDLPLIDSVLTATWTADSTAGPGVWWCRDERLTKHDSAQGGSSAAMSLVCDRVMALARDGAFEDYVLVWLTRARDVVPP